MVIIIKKIYIFKLLVTCDVNISKTSLNVRSLYDFTWNCHLHEMSNLSNS